MIHLENIKKIYKGNGVETVALKGIDLDIGKSEFVSIMGKSGCGKTTLLNIIGCLDNYDDGNYRFEDLDVKKMNNTKLSKFRNKRIGFIFQSFNLINEMTALENVEVPLGYASFSSRERKKISLGQLEKVGLKDKFKNYPTQLSGGQQQRVAIARALANDPDVIVADEPTGNLDSKNGQEIMQIFSLLHSQGKTIILVTHDESVAGFANRNIVLEDGYIVKDSFKQGV